MNDLRPRLPTAATMPERPRASVATLIDTALTLLALAALAWAAVPTLKPWQVPTRWVELLQITPFSAISLGLLMVLIVTTRLRGAVPQRAWPAVVAILALPLLFNALLLLAASPLCVELGTRIAGSSSSSALVGRVLTLGLISEALIVGLGLLLDRRRPQGLRIHGLLLLGALWAGASPLIADSASSAALAGQAWLIRVPLLALAAGAAQAGLWAITFLLTGVLLDSLHGRRPTWTSVWAQWRSGLGKGAVYGAVFMLLIHLGMALSGWPLLSIALSALLPLALLTAAVLGALLFPLARTLIESFDGSAPFFSRLTRAAREPMNALRGAIVGIGLWLALRHGLPSQDSGDRFLLAAAIGAAAFAGADLLRDGWQILAGRRQRLQSWRIYTFGILLGGPVAGALGWYFDAPQLQVVVDKFHRYAMVNFSVDGGAGFKSVVYPLFSKWGAIPLGQVDGGVALLYSESLGGVINWAIAAPLFSLNLVALTALFQRSLKPLRELLSPAGLITVVEQTVRVLRWGPWMAPIISSFLRMAPQPSWYNQDGAIRTVAAIAQSLWLSPEAFRAWGRDVFLGLLAYDWLRVLIWFDHMGLRVATLVNLSFVGADALDEKAARLIGHSGRTRVIPEGIRRFLTWAPLLIPFFIPRGGDWNYAWDGAEALAKNPEAALLPAVGTLVHAYIAGGLILGVAALGLGRVLWHGSQRRRGIPAVPAPHRLSNGQYTLELAADGRGYAHVLSDVRAAFDLDLTRKPDDPQQLRGKFFLFREVDADGTPHSAPWSLTPEPLRHSGAEYACTQPAPDGLDLSVRCAGIQIDATVRIDARLPQEHWTLTLVNLSDRPRLIELTSYQEFAVGPTDQYRRTPFFAAMHVGTSFIRPIQALFARNRLLRTGAQGIAHELAFHAVAPTPGVELIGYQDSRTHFIGRGTLRAPEALDCARHPEAMRPVDDEGLLYSFDPAGALRLRIQLPAHAQCEVRYLDGYASDEMLASARISSAFGLPPMAQTDLNATLVRVRELATESQFESAENTADGDSADAVTPLFSADGRVLKANAEALRPWTHVLANPLGHAAIVSADGDIYSLAGNAQQNGLSTYTLDSLPSQNPSQLIYVRDAHNGDIDTASFVPFRRQDAQREVEFGLGWARFGQRRDTLEIEQTVFVPPELPIEMRLLRIRNHGSQPRRLRVAPYVDIMLGEASVDGQETIETQSHAALGALFFRRAANDFRKGWAFVATSLDVTSFETVRSRFFGLGGDICGPAFVLNGQGDARVADDGRRVAAMAADVTVPPGADLCLTVLIGQADHFSQAVELIRRWRSVVAVQQAYVDTQDWWDQKLSRLRVQTTRPDFDRLVNDWLPYQLLCARLWARSGPQQRSGAFGFRDQLQDIIPLATLAPARARQQILLHAAQQFREGDAPKWWHPSWEGKTGICVRTAASDPHLWLPYVVVEYLRVTGDRGILDVQVPFMEAQPLPPGQEGIMFVPRTSRDHGSVYEHCRRAIDWSLKRLGSHGLPLMGSGDWNDGIDQLGPGGSGESVWLGFFLHGILQAFADLACKHAPASADEPRYRDAATRLRSALDACWHTDTGYLRAYTDAGEPFVTCDALMSAWPALSGAVDTPRALAAIEHGLKHLEKERRVLLLTPPFDETSTPYPGRIAEYPPGVRENGGQYSHGASWLIDALLVSAAGSDPSEATALRSRAWDLWYKISPLSKADAATLARYGLPPHQQPADIYDGAGHAGIGGWAWYTGAAARMLSAAHALLGLEFVDGELKLAEHIGESKGDLRLIDVHWNGQSAISHNPKATSSRT